MGEMNVNLIDESKTSLEEVVNSLLEQKSGTQWAEKTNQFAIDYARKLGDVYGDVWYKGFLPEEFFLKILLPEHGHGEENKTHILLFPDDTSVLDAKYSYKNHHPQYTEECLELVQYLKEEIRIKGFITSIALVIINGKLKHVDGLHRMIALALLLEEGYQYKPIPVFLCDGTK